MIPGRARLEETLTDGYAWARARRGVCAPGRSIETLAAELDHGSSEQQAKGSPTPPGAWRARSAILAPSGLLAALPAKRPKRKSLTSPDLTA